MKTSVRVIFSPAHTTSYEQNLPSATPPRSQVKVGGQEKILLILRIIHVQSYKLWGREQSWAREGQGVHVSEPAAER